MSKRPRVPETKSQPKPNREQRRHPERFENPADEPVSRNRDGQESAVREAGQEEQSVRAKANGHGKKTADKWNQ